MSTAPALATPDSSPYPASVEVDYPDRTLDRLTTLLRPIWALPILIVFACVDGTGVSGGWILVSSGGLLAVPTALMLAFRGKYPRWWFDFSRQLAAFSLRVGAYLALLDDRYPSTDEPQGVHLDLSYPDVEHDLNGPLALVKWLLAIPHYVVLAFLWIAAIACVIYAWFAILFTGRYPRGAFDFVVSVMRWQIRVAAYATLLVTDRYPPFSLS